MIRFDHLKLVKRDWHEVEKIRKWLANAQNRTVTEVAVVHKADRKCCRKEPWSTTLMILSRDVKASVPTIAINLNDPLKPLPKESDNA